MNVLSPFFVYLSFYYIAFLLAFWRARSGRGPKAHNSMAAMIIGVVGLLLIYVPAFFAPGGAAALIVIAALALVPIFLLGFGSYVGIWIASYKRQIVLQSVLGVLALAVPLLLVMALTGGSPGRTGNGILPYDNLAAFQKTTVNGRLGRYPIALPASPQIDTYYTCFEPDSGRVSQCRTHFGLDAGLGPVPGDIPIFHEVHVAQKAEDCTVPCISFERLARWCSTRSDVALEEWCRSVPAEEVFLSYDENSANANDIAQGWSAAPVSVPDALLECRTSERGTICRARFEIARNLQATILMREAKDDELAGRYEAGRAYVTRLWEAMRTDGS